MTPRSREALAYAAGLYEGEGSAGKSRTSLRIQIGMTDLEPLLAFQVAVGMGTITGPYPRGPVRKPYWSYSVYGFEKVQAITAMLWPWLGPRRREQAKVTLAFPRQVKQRLA